MSSLEPLTNDEIKDVKDGFAEAAHALSGMIVHGWGSVGADEHPFRLDPSSETGYYPVTIILPPTNEDGEWDNFTLSELNEALNGAIMSVLQIIAPGSKVMHGVNLFGVDW